MSEAFGTKKAWKEWRAGRDESFRDPYGWFSLVELTWLSEGAQELANFPGLWSASADGQTITVELPEGVALYRDGEEVRGTLDIQVEPGVVDRSLKDDQGREIEVMYRFGKPGIRVRDPQSPTLAADNRVARYKFDPSWVVRGRLRTFAEPKEIVVDAAVPEGTHTISAFAEAEVALPKDRTARLLLTGDTQKAQVSFYDETNNDTTAGWRYAPAAIDGETVVIDFNRAAIFPAHMSPYGTCPKPPAENVVDARVKAGEKRVERP